MRLKTIRPKRTTLKVLNLKTSRVLTKARVRQPLPLSLRHLAATEASGNSASVPVRLLKRMRALLASWTISEDRFSGRLTKLLSRPPSSASIASRSCPPKTGFLPSLGKSIRRLLNSKPLSILSFWIIQTARLLRLRQPLTPSLSDSLVRSSVVWPICDPAVSGFPPVKSSSPILSVSARSPNTAKPTPRPQPTDSDRLRALRIRKVISGLRERGSQPLLKISSPVSEMFRYKATQAVAVTVEHGHGDNVQ